MSVAHEVVEGDGRSPALPGPPRPARPLSTWQLLRVGPSNALAVCDEELFDELLVERRFFWGRLFVVSDPGGIKRVLQDNVDNYPRINAIRQAFEFGSGTGMLCAEGETWRRHRQALNPALGDRAIAAETATLIELALQLAGQLDRLPAGQEINIGEVFGHLLTRSTGRIFAGDDREIDEVVQHIGHFPGEFHFADFMPLPRWLRPFGRFRKSRGAARDLHPLLERLIGERRRDDYLGGHDLLWRIANARDGLNGERLTVSELEDEALTLGSSSATALHVYGWLWYLIAEHPWAEARLHAELAQILGGRIPTPADLPRLSYLRKLVDEAMRLYPPLPAILRRAVADDVICGRRVPRKSIVAVIPWVVHRHRKLWVDPDRFDPERFAPGQVAARSRYAYLPFSVGPHVCIGATLSLTEITATVAVLAQRFRFRLAAGATAQPSVWAGRRPGRGLMMAVEPRGSSRPGGA